MSLGRTLAHKAEAARGTVKKVIGRATGNTRLRAEGRLGQFTGNVKQASAKARDAVKR